MDPTGGGASATLLVTVAAFVAIYVIKWFVQRWRIMKIFTNNGIPSVPAPNIITGHMNKLPEDMNKFYSKWLAEFGDVFGYFICTQPMLVVRDLEVLKHVLIKDFSKFRDRPELALLVKPIGDSLALINGPRWKDLRNILSPCFSSKKMRLMYNLMNDSVLTFLELLSKKSKADNSLDIFGMSQALSMDVINKCALAIKNDCQRNPEDKLFVASQKNAKFTFGNWYTLLLVFPVIGKVLAYLIQFSKKGKEIENNLRNVIAFRRKNPANRFVDMLQLMLDAADDNDGAQNSSVRSTKKLMTDDELVANAITFVIAGFGTTSHALTYTFYLLAKHQDIQDKLRKEINEHLSNNSPDSYDDINSLDYLDQVLNESLRMYPPITTFISRQSASSITVNEITIPEGATVEVPVYHIHHDPKIWPDHEVFDPSRFSAERKQNIQQLAFLPFGAGPRNCIGSRFALMEAKLTICRAIQKYRFVFCEKTEDPLQVQPRVGAITPVNDAVFLNVIEM